MFRSSRSSALLAPVWLASVLLLSLPVVTPRIYASDEVEGFVWLRSIAFDHDVAFENDYRYFYESGITGSQLFHDTFVVPREREGRRTNVNFTTMGCAILWAPFYAAGHVVALATGAPQNGYSRPYIAAVAYGSSIYGFAAVLLSAAIARKLIGHGIAASIAVLLGTPLLFYIYVAPPMTHACSAFAVSLFLWTWLRVRDRWTPAGAALLGVTGALMALVRAQDVFFVAGPALDFGRWAIGRQPGPANTPAARPGVARIALLIAVGAAAFVLAYLPQVFGYLALNGHIGPSVEETRKMTWTAPHAWGVLFSPHYGLFAWTPLALVAIVGLVLLAIGRVARAPRPDAAWIGVCALVMVALQAYIAGSVESWTVAGSFGQRRFVSLAPLLTLGLASLFSAWRMFWPSGRPWLPAIVVALCVWWNLGLMAQFGTHRMDRLQLTLRENAWTTFVVLPREAPSLVWRYLTDRASFYKQPRQ